MNSDKGTDRRSMQHIADIMATEKVRLWITTIKPNATGQKRSPIPTSEVYRCEKSSSSVPEIWG